VRRGDIRRRAEVAVGFVVFGCRGDDHGSVLFVDNDADLALVGVDDPAFMAGITPMEIGETPHVQDDELAVNRGGIARCPQVRRNSRFA
jgi:hypothetical protein